MKCNKLLFAITLSILFFFIFFGKERILAQKSLHTPKHYGWIIEFSGSSILEILKQEYGEQILLQQNPEQFIELAPFIETLKSDLREEHATFIKRYNLENYIIGESFYTFNSISLNPNIQKGSDLLREISIDSMVKKIHANEQVRINSQDSLPMVRAPQARNTSGLNGQGIKIGIIDTGFDYHHNDIDQNYLPIGWDVINDDPDPMDDNGHGTHVAAIAAGLRGIAPRASLVAYKVFAQDGFTNDHIILEAMERTVDPNKDGNLSDHLDVVNMSLGGGGDADSPLALASDQLMDSGIITVIAAGNAGPMSFTIESPGASRKAITVGAAQKNKDIAILSSRGPALDSSGRLRIKKPDIVAPGLDICSAKARQSYFNRYCGGDELHVLYGITSMATPHVSGAAALLRQKYPRLGAHEIKNLLMSSARYLGNDWNMEGAGLLNVERAITSPFIISPKMLQTTIPHTQILYSDVLRLSTVSQNAVRISILPPFTVNLQTGAAISHARMPKRKFETGEIKVEIPSAVFCIDSLSPQNIPVSLHINNLSAGLYEGNFEILAETLQGNCQNGVLTGSSFTQEIPIRIQKAYIFTVNVIPRQYYSSLESKLISYFISYPGSTQMVDRLGPEMELDISQPQTFFSTKSRFDLLAVIKTKDDSSASETITVLARGIDMNQSNNIILEETHAVAIDTTARTLFQNASLENYHHAFSFQKGIQLFYQQETSYLNHRQGYGSLAPSEEIHAYVYFQAPHNEYLIAGAIQGVPRGKTWYDTDTIGVFPFASDGFIPDSLLVQKKINFKEWFPQGNTALMYFHPTGSNRKPVESGLVWVKKPNFTVMFPQNTRGELHPSNSTSDFAHEMIAKYSEPFLQTRNNKTYFKNLHISSDLPSQRSGRCSSRYASFWLSDNGFRVERDELPATVRMRAPLQMYLGQLDELISLPAIDGILELSFDIPLLPFTQSLRIQSTRLWRDCYDRFIIP